MNMNQEHSSFNIFIYQFVFLDSIYFYTHYVGLGNF